MLITRPPHRADRATAAVTIICLNRAVPRRDEENRIAHWRLDVDGAEIGRYLFLEDAQTAGETMYGVAYWLHDPATDTYTGERTPEGRGGPETRPARTPFDRIRASVARRTPRPSTP